jgi:phosphoribosylformimino-5-aminoimidazole carboxamide ribotide isomerase
MLVFPAIDLSGGRVVRLTQGDYGRMTVYGDDPEATAAGFLAEGAACLHVVDLDGAKDGAPQNRAVIARLAKLPLFLQVGGGMRDEAAIERTLGLGVSRVILGTAAAEDFAFTERMGRKYKEKIAVGVDVINGFVAVRGWKRITALDGDAFCRKLAEAGIRTVIYTDIGRDGLLTGANLEAYGRLKAVEGLNVIASGGVSSEAEIAALWKLDVYGVIVGKALYEGRLTLARVLAVARGEEPQC